MNVTKVSSEASFDVFKVNLGTLGEIDITQNPKEDIWAQKYRPNLLCDLVLPKSLKADVEKIIEKGVVPNLLLYSRNGGTGKGSIANVLKNSMNVEMLSINASLHSGIDTIRTTCVRFSASRAEFGASKVIVLDEFAKMSQGAVESLKGLVEEYSEHVRFILTTNDMSNVSQALRTRFRVVDMNFIPQEERGEVAKEMFKRIKGILDIEGIKYSDKDLQMLFSRYFPSYRELLVALEESCRSGELKFSNITVDDEYKEVLKLINKKDFEGVVKISEKINLVNFVHWIGENAKYLEMLKDKTTVAKFIITMNDFQKSLGNGPMVPAITFVTFCVECMKEGVQFNE